jgi:hypothetical protein
MVDYTMVQWHSCFLFERSWLRFPVSSSVPHMSRDSSISTVLGYGIEDRNSIPGKVRNFCSQQCVQTGSGSRPVSLGSFPWVNAAGATFRYGVVYKHRENLPLPDFLRENVRVVLQWTMAAFFLHFQFIIPRHASFTDTEHAMNKHICLRWSIVTKTQKSEFSRQRRWYVVNARWWRRIFRIEKHILVVIKIFQNKENNK